VGVAATGEGEIVKVGEKDTEGVTVGQKVELPEGEGVEAGVEEKTLEAVMLELPERVEVGERVGVKVELSVRESVGDADTGKDGVGAELPETPGEKEVKRVALPLNEDVRDALAVTVTLALPAASDALAPLVTVCDTVVDGVVVVTWEGLGDNEPLVVKEKVGELEREKVTEEVTVPAWFTT